MNELTALPTDDMSQLFDLPAQPQQWHIIPSRKWCIEIASKAPYTSLAELFDRAEKIAEYCKQEF